MRPKLLSRLFVVVLGAAAFAASCHRQPARAVDASVAPTLRLYLLSTTAGAIEPCGCTKDMLGGIDHAAAFVAAGAKEAPHAVVLAAGPMLFMNPTIDPARKTQDQWKAEALSRAFAALGLSAWAPGANDWALGVDELSSLQKTSRADVLASNLSGATDGAKSTRVMDVNGVKLGLAGVSDPESPLGAPPGVVVGDAQAALARALADLKKQGAEVTVALVAADRGRAVRLADAVPGFDVFVVGKSFEQGDGNDAEMPPTLIGDTLVVQAPNHLQAIAVVDLFVRGNFDFKDGTGIADEERKESLTARISELDSRIRDGESHGAAAADLDARRKDLSRLKDELAKIPATQTPPDGSFFRYRLQEVRERLGTDASMKGLLSDYYQRVNDYNKEAFKNKVPTPAAKGESSYIGIEACANCHDEAYKFWQKTPHSHAYATLSDEHKEFNLDCVSCHVTGYEKPGGTTVTHVDGLKDVQCEVCHGPGSRHEDHPTDKSLIIASPPKTLCAATCHHPPHVAATWSVDDSWKIIVGKGHGEK
ncbi:MAG TPA: multiheme c-type cytochrome [Polyangiaceae bacterium]|jgi:hypothetical protein|nr:multiheme c-type cytochrome [Polyangiaceae bacterium]